MLLHKISNIRSQSPNGEFYSIRALTVMHEKDSGVSGVRYVGSGSGSGRAKSWASRSSFSRRCREVIGTRQTPGVSHSVSPLDFFARFSLVCEYLVPSRAC